MFKNLKSRVFRRLAWRRIKNSPTLLQIDFLGCKMLVRAHEEVGWRMVFNEFETADLQYFIEAIRSGDVVYDIGGNVGAYCISIGKTVSSATVVAFEPIPLNAALINVSRLLNQLQNVQIVQKCVSDRSGPIDFSLAEDSAYSSMFDTHRKTEIAKFACEAVSLDDFSAQAGRGPNVVKIDVEGAELKVLQGGVSIFGSATRPRLALIELFDKNLSVFDTSINEITQMMKGWGYRAYVLIDGRKEEFKPAHHNVHYNVFFEI